MLIETLWNTCQLYSNVNNNIANLVISNLRSVLLVFLNDIAMRRKFTLFSNVNLVYLIYTEIFRSILTHAEHVIILLWKPKVILSNPTIGALQRKRRRNLNVDN